MKEIKTTINSDTTKRHVQKYENKNFLHRLFLGRFLDAIAMEISKFRGESILDFGCGEGFFWKEMEQRRLFPVNLTGIDLRDDALDRARLLLPDCHFMKQDLLTWQPEHNFDLVIASQVLEHLPNPEKFLDKLLSLTDGYLLLSVPWEPFFRLANLIRGRDILRLGNHPEHVNLWGTKKFARFVSLRAEIVEFRKVFPFLLVVCKPKHV